MASLLVCKNVITILTMLILVESRNAAREQFDEPLQSTFTADNVVEHVDNVRAHCTHDVSEINGLSFLRGRGRWAKTCEVENYHLNISFIVGNKR